MTLADRLSTKRRELALSRRALSKRAGLAQAVVGQIERGDVTNPSASTLTALASTLDVSVDWLLFGDQVSASEAA